MSKPIFHCKLIGTKKQSDRSQCCSSYFCQKFFLSSFGKIREGNEHFIRYFIAAKEGNGPFQSIENMTIFEIDGKCDKKERAINENKLTFMDKEDRFKRKCCECVVLLGDVGLKCIIYNIITEKIN